MIYFRTLLFSLSFLAITPHLVRSEEVVAEQTSTDINLSWESAVQYARKNLPLEGQLLVKTDGFGYVKVDDEYIHSLFSLLGLEEEGYKKPPYFRSAEATGAHISVFYEDENIIPKEVGQTFHFELNQIVIVSPSRSSSFAVLQVESPELEKLRGSYGLSPKLHGHEFHISLAKKTLTNLNP